MSERGERAFRLVINPTGKMSDADLARCIEIVEAGGGVRPGAAAVGLPEAEVIAVGRVGNDIVGVGAIKRLWADHRRLIKQQSGVSLPTKSREMGYVSVDPMQENHGFGSKIVAKLALDHEGPLFATTSNGRMKGPLERAGFKKKGKEWEGQSGQLALWVKA